MKDFERRNPPMFFGGSDVTVAEDWLQRINRIFTVIGLRDDAIKINAATFQFTGEAIHWWDITVISNPIDRMTWADFERLFLGQYFPEAIRDEKRNELFTLKQGDSTVTEFEMKFSSLARFATAQLADDRFKATRFEAGLRPNIRRALAAFPLVSYADVVTRSLAIEAKEVELKRDRETITPNKNVQAGSSQPHWKKSKHQSQSAPHSFHRPPSYPSRSSFRGSHQSRSNRGNSVYQTKTCRRCGDPNHFVKNCPHPERPAPSVGSALYQAPSYQNSYHGAGGGSQQVQRSQ